MSHQTLIVADDLVEEAREVVETFEEAPSAGEAQESTMSAAVTLIFKRLETRPKEWDNGPKWKSLLNIYNEWLSKEERAKGKAFERSYKMDQMYEEVAKRICDDPAATEDARLQGNFRDFLTNSIGLQTFVDMDAAEQDKFYRGWLSAQPYMAHAYPVSGLTATPLSPTWGTVTSASSTGRGLAQQAQDLQNIKHYQDMVFKQQQMQAQVSHHAQNMRNVYASDTQTLTSATPPDDTKSLGALLKKAQDSLTRK